MNKTISQQELQRRRAQLRKLEGKHQVTDMRAAAAMKARRAQVEQLKVEGEYMAASARNAELMGSPWHERQLRLVRGAMARAGNNVGAYRFFENVYNRLQGRQAGGQSEHADMGRYGRREVTK